MAATSGMFKSVSPESQAFLSGTDVDLTSEGAKLTSPYSQSAWVYIAISRLAEKVSSLPFRISRLDSVKARKIRALRSSGDPRQRAVVRRALGETIIEAGDVVQLFANPHPSMNRQLFWEMVVTWNCLRGEFFVLPLDLSDRPLDLKLSAPRVSRLLTLEPGMFWHIVQGYELSGWRYTGSPQVSPLPSEILLPNEVLHSRTPNPFNYWRGMSPLSVAMLAASSDFAAAQYNKGYWLNNADTGVIVTTDQVLNEEQRRAIEAALRERKRKAGTADRPLFLFGGAKVEKPLLNGMEQQFLANRQMNRQEIGGILKVPDSVMGFSDAKANSLNGGGTAITAEMIAWLCNVISPLCCHIEAAVEPVVQTFGDNLIGWFDVESDPVMQEARRVRLDSGIKAFAIGATFNDINDVYDLGFPRYKWGNKSFLPFSLQEVGALDEPPGEDDPIDAEVVDDEQAALANPFLRMQKLLGAVKTTAPAILPRTPDTEVLWHAHVNSRRKHVNAIKAKVGRVLNEARKTALAKLGEMELTKAAPQAWTVKIGGVVQARSIVDLIFDAQKFGNTLNVLLQNPLTSVLQSAGNELHSELGLDDPWKLAPETAKDYLASRQLPIQGVGGTVRDQLNTSLQAGLDAGETTAQLADRVREVFNDLNEGEALRVARTEVNGGYNFARHEAMTDAGIGYKAWLSSHGPTVRPAHAQAERDYLDAPIPVDQPFRVGGEELMYPGDDSLGASPGNLINCGCIQLAAVKTGEDEKSLTFKICGLGEMKFPKDGRTETKLCHCGGHA